MSSSLRIGVITNITTGQSYQDLKLSAQNLGVAFEQIPVPFIELSNFATSEFVKTALTYDIVYYRTGLRDTALDHLTNILKTAHIPLINGSEHAGSHRKIQQSLIAGAHDLRQPKSLSMTKPDYDTIASQLGSTFVAKPDFASHGSDVKLVSSQTDLLELKKSTNRDRFIFQELIENATEYRVYTLGANYVASYKKIPSSGDFRANLHAGGLMTHTEPELVPLLSDFSTKVSKAFQADIAGLDIFIKDNTCIFLELNWQPGWENLDAITGTKFSNESIKYMIDVATSRL